MTSGEQYNIHAQTEMFPFWVREYTVYIGGGSYYCIRNSAYTFCI